jgi:hypothetical protein
MRCSLGKFHDSLQLFCDTTAGCPAGQPVSLLEEDTLRQSRSTMAACPRPPAQRKEKPAQLSRHCGIASRYVAMLLHFAADARYSTTPSADTLRLQGSLRRCRTRTQQIKEICRVVAKMCGISRKFTTALRYLATPGWAKPQCGLGSRHIFGSSIGGEALSRSMKSLRRICLRCYRVWRCCNRASGYDATSVDSAAALANLRRLPEPSRRCSGCRDSVARGQGLGEGIATASEDWSVRSCGMVRR